MTELGRRFENRLDVDVLDLRAQAYLFIASANFGMFERQMGVAITASQLHRAEVNKFLLAQVMLIIRVHFRQYFDCLRERIFNCCNVLMSS